MKIEPGSYRRKLIDEVTALFRLYADRPLANRNFREALTRERGFAAVGVLGSSRIVYRKGALVVKVLRTTWDQNRTEFENYKTHPELLPPVFAWLESDTKLLPQHENNSFSFDVHQSYDRYLNVLIEAYAAEARGNEVGTSLSKLGRVFGDIADNPGNVGRFGKKLVARDAGFYKVRVTRKVGA